MSLQHQPNTPDEAEAWLEEKRAEWAKAHEERMAKWEYFKTEEYKEEITQYLLATTHEDIEPPWLKDPTEQDNTP